MKQEQFLSVIIPVYQALPYLPACYESIRGQLQDDMEILLVDDCSTDGSAELCEQLAGQDSRIRVIRMEANRGVSCARNRGLEQARGRYVTFVDADDTLAGGAYQAVREEIVRFPEPDVVLFGAREVYWNPDGTVREEKAILPARAQCRSSQEVHGRIAEIDRLTLYGYVWNKVYRRAMLEENAVRFDPHCAIQEDFLFNADFFDHAQSMAVMDRDFYRYSKRPSGSATGSFIPDYYEVHMQRIRRLADQLEGWGVLDESARRHLARTYTRYVFSAFARNLDPRSNRSAGERRAFMRQVFHSELYARMMPNAACSGGVFGVLERLLKSGNPALCAAAACAIHRVRGI